MSKKILIPVGFVIVLAIAAGALGTLAVAQASQPAAGALSVTVKINIGKVTAVDVAASTLSLQTLKGPTLTYKVDANTRFRSRAGQIKSLSEVKTGMLAVVTSQKEANGSLLARVVLVGDRKGIRLGRLAAGKVTAVGSGSFTILNLKGTAMTFQVDAATRFRSKGQAVQSLGDLKAGMTVLVRYKIQPNSDLLAKQVLVKTK